MSLTFVRRIGRHPHADGQETDSSKGCPDIWELNNGKFAVIGLDRTEQLREILPSDASCGDDERIVIVDRHVLINARVDIPNK